MEGQQSIFLIGPMGSGKTTVGRALARRLQREFYDSDREIEGRCGVDIAFIFDKEGEAGFRRRESRMIEELTRHPAIVLATGGGVVLSEANRECLKSRGTVVYLRCSVEQQLERTARSSHRPLLQTADPRARLTELMALRGPLYEGLADLIIDTEGARVQQVVSRILQRLAAGGAEPSAAGARGAGGGHE